MEELIYQVFIVCCITLLIEILVLYKNKVDVGKSRTHQIILLVYGIATIVSSLLIITNTQA